MKNDSGSALIITMIALGILTAMTAASLQRSTVDNTVAGRWAKSSQARESAEGGLNRIATKVLSTYSSTTPNSFNSLLGTIQTGVNSGGQYSVMVVDNSSVGGVNQDGDASASTDSDQIFRLISTGKVGPSEQVIEAFFRVVAGTQPVTWPPAPTGCPSPPCNSAALLCGPAEVVRTGGASTLDGSDYPFPPYGCKGSGCNVSPISGTTGNYDVIGDSTLTVSSGITNLANTGAASGCAAWQTFYDTWSNVSPTAPGVVHVTGTSLGTSNDCSSPKVYLIDTASTTLSLASNSYYCGTFIFKSNTTFSAAGTTTLVGAFVMMGDYTTNALNPGTGTSNIIGKVITRSTVSDSQVELGIGGSGQILYSSSGLDAALQALNTANTSSGSSNHSLQVVAWRTKDK